MRLSILFSRDAYSYTILQRLLACQRQPEFPVPYVFSHQEKEHKRSASFGPLPIEDGSPSRSAAPEGSTLASYYDTQSRLDTIYQQQLASKFSLLLWKMPAQEPRHLSVPEVAKAQRCFHGKSAPPPSCQTHIQVGLL